MITLDVLLPIAAKGALVLLLAAAFSILLINRSAAFRHMAWAGGLVALFLLPLLSLAMPKLPIPGLALRAVDQGDHVIPTATVVPSAARDLSPSLEAVSARPESEAAAPTTPTVAPVPELVITATRSLRFAPLRVGMTLSPRAAVPIIWLTGTVLLLVWLAIGHVRARTIARRSRVSLAPEWTGLIDGARELAGVTAPVEIRESDTLTVPLTIGLFRPVIVVPVEGRDWSSEHRQDVLIHELAHIARRDCLTHTIGWVACALHWFNPLAWVALYRARVEREHACDDVVLASGSRPSVYAQELLATAQVAQVPFAAGAASLAMARRSQLTGRLLAILDANRHRTPATLRGAAVLAGVGLVLVLPVAALTPDRSVESKESVASDRADWSSRANARDLSTGEEIPRLRHGITSDSSHPIDPAQAICPRAKDGEARSVHLTKSMTITGQGNAEDGSGNSWHVWSGVDCAVKIQIFGKVTFNAAETDVASLSRGGRIEFTQSQGRDDRVYRVVEADGELERRYTLNGRELPVDAAVEKWRAELVLAFIRQSGYDAEARAKRIMAASGVDGVLAEIKEISSDYAAGRYFSAIVAAKMDDPTTARVVTVAGGRLESDYELAKVLTAVPVAALSGPTARAAYVQATESIESDYELGRTLSRALAAGSDNPEVTKALLKRASTMESDYEVAQLLVGLVATGTIKGDAALVYIDGVVSTIESDYEKQRVLTAITPEIKGDTRLMTQALRTAATIDSDHSLGEYLKQVLAMTTLSGDLIAPFFAAVETIESDFSQQEVLIAALGRSSGPEVVTQVINATRHIESDHSQAEVLIAATRRGLTEDQRTLLRNAARGIESDHDRGRVLDALK